VSVAPLALVLLLAGDPAADLRPEPAAFETAEEVQAPEPPSDKPASVPPVGPPPPHTGIKATLKAIPSDFAHLATGTNLGILGIGGVIALAVHPADAEINDRLAGGSGTRSFFYPGKLLGNGGILVGLSLGTYALGRATDNRVVSHLGMDLVRSLAVSGALTYAIKLSVRRDRPNGNCCSFPSGHASATFSIASVLWRHLGWKAAVPTYTVATYVAASRLHLNVHFLSDVVFGSAIGIASGRAVMRHDRHFYGFYPMPVPGGGVGVMAVASFR
jgi:undecaprenyl-diphosphatase